MSKIGAASKSPQGAVEVIKTFTTAELKPSTGSAGREVTLARAQEIAYAIARLNGIYLQHPAHRDIFARIDYLRMLGKADNGPKAAVRVSGPSFAGKSTALKQYAGILEKRGEMTATKKTVVHVSLDRSCTTKRLIASCLEAFGDEYSDRAVESLLRKRLYLCIERFQTEVLFIDEVQHMDFRSSDRDDATDMLKRFLDDSVASLVLAGNEDARSFLRSNIQLANRMIAPADINPLDRHDRTQAGTFSTFVKRLDAQIVEAGLMLGPSNLAEERTLLCLHEVSRGLLGRVVGLVRAALEIALGRGATRIEPFDLAAATREWAVPLGIIPYDPFSKGVRVTAARDRRAENV